METIIGTNGSGDAQPPADLQGSSAARFESPSSDCVVAEIFSDGFESGDTASWSLTVP